MFGGAGIASTGAPGRMCLTARQITPPRKHKLPRGSQRDAEYAERVRVGYIAPNGLGAQYPEDQPAGYFTSAVGILAA